MHTVYRVERPDGSGPYVGYMLDAETYGDSPNAIWLTGHGPDGDHPIPLFDGISLWHTARCGFADIDQLSAWFTDAELVTLYAFGFRIVEIRCGHVEAGDRQVAFDDVHTKSVWLDVA